MNVLRNTKRNVLRNKKRLIQHEKKHSAQKETCWSKRTTSSQVNPYCIVHYKWWDAFVLFDYTHYANRHMVWTCRLSIQCSMAYVPVSPECPRMSVSTAIKHDVVTHPCKQHVTQCQVCDVWLFHTLYCQIDCLLNHMPKCNTQTCMQ